MSDMLREQLSAFMDGELPREECKLLLKRVSTNAELRECWNKWHLIGDTLHGEMTDDQIQNLAQRVERELDAVTAQPAPLRPPREHRLMRRSAAVAAGVAVIGVAGLVGALVSRQVGGGPVLVPGASGGSAVSAPTQQVDWRNAPQPVRVELSSYLLMHEPYGAGSMVLAQPGVRSAAAGSRLSAGAGGS
ncbi:MAG: sigma-E factor negative regulatory protein [Gammaproteobacteria bacterium]|nr:sigma-E factor negative regulatory protein [Gammaproteobacteria bacterium]